MKCDEETEQQLAHALGKPKYFIDTAGLKKEERYCWFPTAGDSMTDGSSKSIPGGSLVLARWLKINCLEDVPLHCPIVVIVNYNGEQFCLLKSACAISHAASAVDDNTAMLCLRSYNPAPRCDDLWVPFTYIKFIFVVEKIRRPDGSEFIPKQEEVIRQATEML